MIKSNFSKFPIKLVAFIRVNWGVPLIVIFITLLMSSAFLLSAGFSSTSDKISLYAFYSLSIGILLQIICNLKYKKTGDTEVF